MKRITALIPLVKEFYPNVDPAHDWAHVGRVAATAKKLAEQEKLDVETVLAAVYCHDIVNLPKDHPDRKRASELAAEKATPLLLRAGFTEAEVKEISTGIVEHSFSRGAKPSTKLAAVVQDADRLDALGAIGILRCAAVNTQMKATFYDPFDPLAEARELDDKRFMLDHYTTKLYKLPGLMNTETARRMGEERCEVMREFIATLLKEVR